MLETTPQELPIRLSPRPPRAMASARLCVAAASSARGVSTDDILDARRGCAKNADARHLAIYLLHVVFNESLSSCGRSFSRDRTSVRHACARIEDARDSADADFAIARLEAALRAQADMLSELHLSLSFTSPSFGEDNDDDPQSRI